MFSPLPLPPLPMGPGPVLPVPPVTTGTEPEPPVVTPLPGVFELPQAMEPSSATPVHKEKGMVFISDFLRSIWVDHPRRFADRLTRTRPLGAMRSTT
jgi:hypothetical protein